MVILFAVSSDVKFLLDEPYQFNPPASEASIEVANFIERKNTHSHAYKKLIFFIISRVEEKNGFGKQDLSACGAIMMCNSHNKQTVISVCNYCSLLVP